MDSDSSFPPDDRGPQNCHTVEFQSPGWFLVLGAWWGDVWECFLPAWHDTTLTGGKAALPQAGAQAGLRFIRVTHCPSGAGWVSRASSAQEILDGVAHGWEGQQKHISDPCWLGQFGFCCPSPGTGSLGTFMAFSYLPPNTEIIALAERQPKHLKGSLFPK